MIRNILIAIGLICFAVAAVFAVSIQVHYVWYNPHLTQAQAFYYYGTEFIYLAIIFLVGVVLTR